jgi:4-hydroxy-tetrahydrodipicolinate reductase
VTATCAPLRVAIAGTSGRMGRMLIETVLGAADCTLAGALDRSDSPMLGQDAGAALGRATGIAVTADLGTGLARAQVLIDFTRPDGTLTHLQVCRAHGVAAVIGTTGFTPAQKAEIGEHARHIGIVMAPNMSVGVNVVMKLLEQAARALNQGYDIEIVEAHHRHKVDAPSGTALQMGEVVARRAGARPVDSAPSTAARALPASGILRPSALQPSAAATSSATTPCCSPASASASRSPIAAAVAPPMPRAACARRASWPAARAGPVRHERRARPAPEGAVQAWKA